MARPRQGHPDQAHDRAGALSRSDNALQAAQDTVDGIIEDIARDWPRQPASLPDSLIGNVQGWVLGLLVKLRAHEPHASELADELEPDSKPFGNERPTPYVLPEEHPARLERQTVRKRRGESPHAPADDPRFDEEITARRSPYARQATPKPRGRIRQL